MNPKDPAFVLDEISDERIPQDVNLMPGILAKAQQGNRTTMKSAAQLRIFAAVLLILVLLIALFSMPGIVSALQRMIGFLPGVGEVDQSVPLRVLSAPVTDSRDGYTITVESALLDSTRTVLNYQIEGAFPSYADPTLKPLMCEEYPILRLPNGQELRYPLREGGPVGGAFHWRDVYSAVPAGQNRAVLVFPCLSELPAGDGPRDWEIPLAFAPAPPEMTVYPVLQPSAVAQATSVPPADVASPVLPSALPEDQAQPGWLQVSLQGISVLPDGYYLQTLLSWPQTPGLSYVELYSDALHLFDASGQEVPIWQPDPILPSAPAENLSLALNLQTAPISAPGPARLVIDYMAVQMIASTSFTFDVGENPQPGQTWDLNKDLDINGYTLRVVSAEYIKAEPGEPPWLMLYLSSDSGILTVIAMDTQHEILGTGGSPLNPNVPFRAGWRYKNGFPSGQIQVDITSITVRRPGPWSLEWTPPPAQAQPEQPDQPASVPLEKGICEEQTALEAASNVIPEGMAGRIAYSNNTGDMFILDLNKGETISLGYGLFPDLSPDGKLVVYRGSDEGLHIRDLVHGSDILIPGTVEEGIIDIWPRWSPNSQQIAFDRVKDHTTNIYLVNADGSDLRVLLDGPENENFLGWSPDGRSITYMVTAGEHETIHVLDLQTGQSFTVGSLPPRAVLIRLSPDGKRVMYHQDPGLYMARLDGSGSPPILLASRTNDLSGPIWSPDSQWAAMMHFGNDVNAKPNLVLLQPDTCRLITLGEQGGLLSSWAP